MLWGQHSGKPVNLTYDAFLSLAEQEGIDLSNKEYLERLHKEVLGLLQDMAAITAIDLGSAEPWGFHEHGSDLA